MRRLPKYSNYDMSTGQQKRLVWHSPTVLLCSVASYQRAHGPDEKQPLVNVNAKVRQSISGWLNTQDY